MLWLIFHVPGLRYLVYRLIVPLWNVVVSNIEAIFYLHERKVAKDVLAAAKHIVSNHEMLAEFYVERAFTWNADPMGGLLDFSSKPWVSVAKNHGDCDDMMKLAHEILATGRQCYIYHRDGRGHAIYLIDTGGSWYVMSNQKAFGPFPTRQVAWEHHYGAGTRYAFVC